VDADVYDEKMTQLQDIEVHLDLHNLLEEIVELAESSLLSEAGFKTFGETLDRLNVTNRVQLDKLCEFVSTLDVHLEKSCNEFDECTFDRRWQY
jgi:hypothetical protein